MAHSNLSHRRTHNLLLISKLLNQRDYTSPFTLIQDSLEQPATQLLRGYIDRASVLNHHVVFLGFETVRNPRNVGRFVRCYDRSPAEIARAVDEARLRASSKRHLIIIDSLHALCSASLDAKVNLNLVAYLSSWLAPSPTGQASVVAAYHTDIPLPRSSGQQSYQPSPLTLLSYLATTLLTVHSLPNLISAKLARERSQAAPSYGLSEEKEGVIIGLKPTKFERSSLKTEEKGLVLELEHRRKSGRGVHEWYFLPTQSSSSTSATAQNFKETVTILDDHPFFSKARGEVQTGSQDLSGLTFELGLTDRQKLERDGVVLPYFDAQKGGGLGGPGEGGRILYDMGSEDDFDEEEDEI